LAGTLWIIWVKIGSSLIFYIVAIDDWRSTIRDKCMPKPILAWAQVPQRVIIIGNNPPFLVANILCLTDYCTAVDHYSSSTCSNKATAAVTVPQPLLWRPTWYSCRVFTSGIPRSPLVYLSIRLLWRHVCF
jgi:hypothetical protein